MGSRWLLVVSWVALLSVLPTQPAFAGAWPPLATDVAAISHVDQWMSEWSLFEDQQARDTAPRPELAKLETRYLDEQVKARPGNTPLLVGRGLHHLKLGNPKKAIGDLNRAIKKQPRSAAALYYRGLANERQGKLKQATADYGKAVAAEPGSPFSKAALAGLTGLATGPSPDQLALIKRHGMPDAFTVYVAANQPKSKLIVRTEIWTYHRLGREFTFLERRQFGEQRIDVDKAATIHPLYAPYQFLTGMRFVDMVELIREDTYHYMELKDTIVRDGELAVTTQLVTGFKDGGLFYVRAQPLVLE